MPAGYMLKRDADSKPELQNLTQLALYNRVVEEATFASNPDLPFGVV